MKHASGIIMYALLAASTAHAAGVCETAEVTIYGGATTASIADRLAQHGLRIAPADPDLKITITAIRAMVDDGVDKFGSAVSHTQNNYMVELRMRDGTTTVGHGSLESALDQPLSAMLSHAATVTLRSEPATATIRVDHPLAVSGTGELVLHCISDSAKIEGTAFAKGYCKQPISLTAINSPTWTAHLDTTSCALVATSGTTTTPIPPAEVSVSAVQILGFVFGGVLVLSLFGVAIWLTIREKDPPPFAMLLFRIIIALGAGGLGGILAGWLSVHLKLTDSFVVDAVGGLALFVIVYFYNPPTKIAAVTAAQSAPTDKKPEQK